MLLLVTALKRKKYACIFRISGLQYFELMLNCTGTIGGNKKEGLAQEEVSPTMRFRLRFISFSPKIQLNNKIHPNSNFSLFRFQLPILLRRDHAKYQTIRRERKECSVQMCFASLYVSFHIHPVTSKENVHPAYFAILFIIHSSASSREKLCFVLFGFLLDAPMSADTNSYCLCINSTSFRIERNLFWCLVICYEPERRVHEEYLRHRRIIIEKT